MPNSPTAAPDHTALRVALWRALHVEIDAQPSVLDDTLGLQLAAPDANWRERPDMHPQGTRGYRASIVGRARFVEDLVEEAVARGVTQYVLLGAGLDTFAERRPQIARRLSIFEIDQPAPQAWKRLRLIETGLGVPDWLRLVPVDFEAGESWRDKLGAAGFDSARPALVASTGVSMYLSREANLATLREIAALAPGSTLVMSFLLPPDQVDAAERPMFEMVMERATAAGTPFRSLFTPEQMLALAREAGFRTLQCVTTEELIARYFAGRPDGLKPATGEPLLVAKT